MGEADQIVYGGVDTHRDDHVAAVVDGVGRVLGSESFAAEESGYRRMVAWFESRGQLVRVGVEGTGSYGAGLARYLTEAGVEVVEVNRPNRQLRRQKGGKTGSVDAEAAARAAASGEAAGVPKSGMGPVERIRMLWVVRRSAVKARTQAANQIHALVVTAPEPLKQRLKGMNLKAQVKTCARFRPGTDHTTTAYAKRALQRLAHRYQALDAEITQLEAEIRHLCAQANPALLATEGVGPDTAAALPIAAGDNPERMKSERSFAALCGAGPVQASSGRTLRHRLDRGGNRQANSALWRIATTRMRTDAATKEYVTKRETEGKKRTEIIRCLKRHIVREIYRLLTNPPPTPNCARLRTRRLNAGITLTQTAQAVGTHPNRISALERGQNHNHHLATRYQNWLHTHRPQPTCESHRVLRRLDYLGDNGVMGRAIMYSPEVRERAVRLVSEHRGEHRSEWAAICSIAAKFGCSSETLRLWVRRAETDQGLRPGLTSDQTAELKELRRENRELRRANEILRKASAYFAQAELDRRPRR